MEERVVRATAARSYDAPVPILSEPTPETCPGIVDAVPDAVVLVDAAGAVRYANARAAAFFGGPARAARRTPRR